MEEILVEGQSGGIEAPGNWMTTSLPEWNLPGERLQKGASQPWLSVPMLLQPFHPHGQRNNLLRTQIKQSLGHLFILGALASVVQEELLL